MQGAFDRVKRLLLALAVASVLLLSLAPAAGAIQIRQVHPAPATSGDWVELQFTANGESITGDHLLVYFSGGMVRNDYTIPSTPTNAQSQRTVLIANSGSVQGETPDFNPGLTSDLDLVGGDGAVCLNNAAMTPIDCVAYGNYNNATALPVGNPAVATQDGQTLQRTIARGCTTALDAADDTNNSGADFALTTDPPRNNSTTPTEKPCAGGKGGTTPPPGSNFKCQGKAATLIGSPGKDEIKGTQKRDVIVSFGGNDKINGRGGNDVLCGVGGKDTLRGGAGKDTLDGGPGKDLLAGGASKDKLIGGAGKDVCKGGAAADTGKKCETEKTL